MVGWDNQQNPLHEVEFRCPLPCPLSFPRPLPPTPGVGENLNSRSCSSGSWPWSQYFLGPIACIYFSKPYQPQFTEEEGEARSWEGQVGTEGQKRGGADLRSRIEFLLEIGWREGLSAGM